MNLEIEVCKYKRIVPSCKDALREKDSIEGEVFILSEKGNFIPGYLDITKEFRESIKKHKEVLAPLSALAQFTENEALELQEEYSRHSRIIDNYDKFFDQNIVPNSQGKIVVSDELDVLRACSLMKDSNIKAIICPYFGGMNANILFEEARERYRRNTYYIIPGSWEQKKDSVFAEYILAHSDTDEEFAKLIKNLKQGEIIRIVPKNYLVGFIYKIVKHS